MARCPTCGRGDLDPLGLGIKSVRVEYLDRCGLLLNLNVVAPGGGGSDLPVERETRSIPCILKAPHPGVAHRWDPAPR